MKLIPFVLVTALTCTVSLASEYVTNGTFADALSGWTKGGTSASVYWKNEAPYADGTPYAWIDSSSRLIQTVTLAAGQQYRVSLDYRSAPSYEIYSNSVSVAVDGPGLNFDTTYAGTGIWKHGSASFTAPTSGSFTVSLNVAFSKRMLVDNVSITEVVTTPVISISTSPDPASVVLTFSGILQESDDLVTWTAVTPQPSSPVTLARPAGSKFWRSLSTP